MTLLQRLGASTLADAIVRVMVWDDDSPGVTALVDDLEAAPLVAPEDIPRLVHGAHRNTVASVLSDTLSPMQLGALREMAHGARNLTELAELLGCSQGSAGAHLARARARLLANTSEHAVALALGMGLFEAPVRQSAEGRFIARSLLRPRKREREVLLLVAKGYTNGEIAKELGFSIDTAKDHVEDLVELYAARNRTHLIALAFAVGTLRFVSSRHHSDTPATLPIASSPTERSSMRVILSAMGRAAVRDFLIAFLALATGILAAPNIDQAAALAGAASIAGLVAVVRGLRVFVPQLSQALADAVGAPLAYAEVVLTGITTFLIGFLALAEGVLSAPSLGGAKAAAVAGTLAIGTALVRVIQAFLTPGEPGPGGISTPPQPVPAEGLPTPMPEGG